MKAMYWSTRDKELRHDDAHTVLVQVCKCVETHLSSNEQENKSMGQTDPTGSSPPTHTMCPCFCNVQVALK